MKGIIIGGGIAGLGAAIALAEQGIEIKVYEKAPAIRKNGLGFILLPNGLEALEAIGLRDEVIRTGHSVEKYQCRSNHGKVLHELGLENQVGISRYNLVDILMRALPRENIGLGMDFEEIIYDESTEKYWVIFKDGSRDGADFIVGADGISSRLRTQLFPECGFSEIPEKEIVGKVCAPHLIKELRGVFNKYLDVDGGLAFGFLPADAHCLVWYMQFDYSRKGLPGAGAENMREFVERHIGHWPEPIPEIIRNSHFEDAHLWDVQFMELLPSFYRDKIVLLGDAAHPLLPFTSQGANSALEDAVVLARIMGQNKNSGRPIHEMFQQFTQQRREQIGSYVEFGRTCLQEFLSPGGLSQHKPVIPLAIK